jgi:hypothetical protein
MKHLFAVIATGALLSVLVFAQGAPRQPKQNSLIELSGELRSLSQKVAPAVVQISVSGYGPLDQSTGHAVSLFGRLESIGSGVIVDPDGTS